MIRSIRGLAAGAVLASMYWLAACSGSDSADPAAATVDPSTLCVSSACGTKTRLLEIPNAENTLFTAQGRLFVSGGSNVYEVSKDAAGFHAAPLYDGSCNFTGLAQRGDVLYAACFDLHLYAANLSDAVPKLQAIYSLAGMAAPNGMTSGPDGELYVADGPISTSHSPSPKIVRLQFDAADPMKVTQQLTWLSKDVGLPNGLSRRDRTLYFTDSSILPPSLGEIRSVEIQPDGSAGTPQVLTTILASLPDDVSVAGDDLLLAVDCERRKPSAGQRVVLRDRSHASRASRWCVRSTSQERHRAQGRAVQRVVLRSAPLIGGLDAGRVCRRSVVLHSGWSLRSPES